MKQHEFHSVAGLFPLLPEDELQALADDIKANGLQVPIIVDDEGNIIDGRNRYLACERVGVEPDYRVSTSNDFVARECMSRRVDQKLAIFDDVVREAEELHLTGATVAEIVKAARGYELVIVEVDPEPEPGDGEGEDA